MSAKFRPYYFSLRPPKRLPPPVPSSRLSSEMGGDGAPPRVSTADITALGLTIDKFIECQVEIIKKDPMEDKEQAVAVLHALSLQAPKENTELIARYGGLKQLISLAENGSHGAQAHAAACLAMMIQTSAELAVQAVKGGAVPPLAKVSRSHLPRDLPLDLPLLL